MTDESIVVAGVAALQQAPLESATRSMGDANLHLVDSSKQVAQLVAGILVARLMQDLGLLLFEAERRVHAKRRFALKSELIAATNAFFPETESRQIRRSARFRS
jgi:hypothetical protein